jgi:hypothetical protein
MDGKTMCDCVRNHPEAACGSMNCTCHNDFGPDDFVYMSITFQHVRRANTTRIYDAASRAAGSVDSSLSIFKSIDEDPIEEEQTFEQDLAHVINKHSMENKSGTPDYILAQYLDGCLLLFDRTIRDRAEWRGESTTLPALLHLRNEGQIRTD